MLTGLIGFLHCIVSPGPTWQVNLLVGLDILCSQYHLRVIQLTFSACNTICVLIYLTFFTCDTICVLIYLTRAIEPVLGSPSLPHWTQWIPSPPAYCLFSFIFLLEGCWHWRGVHTLQIVPSCCSGLDTLTLGI